MSASAGGSLDDVLFTTDQSEASWRALSPAVDLAKMHGGTLHILTVVEDAAFSLATMYENASETAGLIEERMKGVEQAARDELKERARSIDVPTELHVIRSPSPVKEIINLARKVGAATIVIAREGRSGWGRLFVGSTADKVLSQSPVPVLVVPHSEES